MFLYIARHAWAGERDDARWPDDSLRELTSDGIDRYTRVVKTLADRDFKPDRIATSPYSRCRQTAEIIAAYVAGEPAIDELQALEPGSDLFLLLEWSKHYSRNGDNLCWVGHNPDVELLAAEMIGDSTAQLRFAKGAITAIRFADEIGIQAGELYWHTTAKLLGI